MTALCGVGSGIPPDQRRNTGRSIIFRAATQNLDLNNSNFRTNIGPKVHSME
jgi:hypothetical protein